MFELVGPNGFEWRGLIWWWNRRQITLEEGQESFVILIVEKNISFVYAAVIYMVVAVFDKLFDDVFGGHDFSVADRRKGFNPMR